MGMTVSLTALDKKTVRTLQRENAIYDKKLKDPTTKGSDLAVLNKLKTKNQAQIAKTLELFRKNKDGKHKTELAGLTPSLMSVQKIYEKIGQNTAEKPDWMPEFLFNLGERPIENGLVVGGAAIALGSFLSTPAGEGAAGLLKEGMKAIFMKSTEAGLVLNWSAIGIAAGGALLAGALIYKKHRKQKEMAASVAFEAEEVANKGTARDEDTLKAARTDKAKFDALVQEAADDPEVYEHLQNVARNSENSVYAKMAQRIIIAAQNEKNKADYALAGQTLQSKFEATPEAVAYMTEQAEVANIEDLYKAKGKAAAEFASMVPAVVTAQKAIDAVFAMSAADLAAKYGGLTAEEFSSQIAKGLSPAELKSFTEQITSAWDRVAAAKELTEAEAALSSVEATGHSAGSAESIMVVKITEAREMSHKEFKSKYPKHDDFIKQVMMDAKALDVPAEIIDYAIAVYKSMEHKKDFDKSIEAEAQQKDQIEKYGLFTKEQVDEMNAAADAIKAYSTRRPATFVEAEAFRQIATTKDPKAILSVLGIKPSSPKIEAKLVELATKAVDSIIQTREAEQKLTEPMIVSPEGRAVKNELDALQPADLLKFKDAKEFIAAYEAKIATVGAKVYQEQMTAYAKSLYAAYAKKEIVETRESLQSESIELISDNEKSFFEIINKTAESADYKSFLTKFPTSKDFYSKVPKSLQGYAKTVYDRILSEAKFEASAVEKPKAPVSAAAAAAKTAIDEAIKNGEAESIETILNAFPKTDPSSEYVAAYAEAAKTVVAKKRGTKDPKGKYTGGFDNKKPAKRSESAEIFAQIHSQAKDPKAFIAAVGSKEAYLETITDPAMKSVAAAAYDAAVATIAYDSVVAEKSAVVDASGKVTQIDGHAPDANRSFFDNVLGELFKPGSPFYDETGHNMFADLETAVVTDKKPLKEIATILKSKYGIDLDTIQKAAKGQEKAAGPEATA